MDLLALEEDRAFIRLLGSGKDLDECALAGAVVADERDDLIGIDVEVAAAKGLDVAVVLDDATRLQQWFGHSVSG